MKKIANTSKFYFFIFCRRRKQELDTLSEAGYNTSNSMDTNLPSSVSRCTSLNMIKDPYAINPTARIAQYETKP